MCFAVTSESGAFEYSSASLRGVLATAANLPRPAFWRMLLDVRRFQRDAAELLESDSDESLGDYLERNGYSRWFVDRLLVPQAAAVWSADPGPDVELPGALPRPLLPQSRDALAARPAAVVHRRRRVRPLRRGAHRAPAQRRAARHAGGLRTPVPRPRRGHAARRRRRALRRGRHRRALRPGARAARRRVGGRAAAAGRDPLPGQRGRAAHRPLAAAAAAARLGQLGLPPARRAQRPEHRQLPHEPAPGPRRRPRADRHAQPHGGDRSGRDRRDQALVAPRLHARTAWRPRSSTA